MVRMYNHWCRNTIKNLRDYFEKYVTLDMLDEQCMKYTKQIEDKKVGGYKWRPNKFTEKNIKKMPMRVMVIIIIYLMGTGKLRRRAVDISECEMESILMALEFADKYDIRLTLRKPFLPYCDCTILYNGTEPMSFVEFCQRIDDDIAKRELD